MKVYPVVFHDASVYQKPCPACGAPAGRHCISASGRINTKAHICRSREVEKHDPLPDLRAWWRAMKPYEGMYAKPRPADLVVP